MKKTLLSMVALLVAGHAAMAQNGLTEIPAPDGSQFMCTVLSPNGKYIGGVCYGVNAGFIFDVREQKMVKYAAPDPLTSSLRTPRNINLTFFLGKNANYRAFLV